MTAMVTIDEATDTLARELRNALGRAFDAGCDEPLELLSVVNVLVILILQDIKDSDYRTYVAGLIEAKIPELLRAASPGLGQTRH
jgi:hypothetical protein